ncbi:glycerophosphodiester phosphodiesterase [Ekhidna sp.]|uniref:glycerophosphodiester phosphodiesterase n=1 Tax=Ekhidna sp. TaxID=2608089 RepID=UPI003CCB9E6F
MKSRKIIFKSAAVMTISLFIFLVLTVLIPFLKWKSVSIDDSNNFESVKVIGHRGAAGLAPENTITSIRKAIDLKVDVIEIDIHLTKDDRIVVMHDYEVSRTTNGEGDIEDLTLGEIKNLDAGSWFSDEYSGEKVPTLEEVIDLINGKCELLIEIKWPKKGIYKGIVSKMAELITLKGATSWITVQSFETKYLHECIEEFPDIRINQLVFGKSSIAPFYYDRKFRFGYFRPLDKAQSVNIFYMYANESFVKKMHNNGYQVAAFTLNKPEDILKAANVGLDGIITDYPNLALKALNRR